MVQTAGFGFQPGTVSSGMESRIALSGGQVAPLRFVDGASLVPRSNPELWMSGRLQGIQGLASGIAGAGQAIGSGLERRTQRKIEDQRFMTDVALKKEDQRIRGRNLELAANSPVNAARIGLLREQTREQRLKNQRGSASWNPMAPLSQTESPVPDDMPEDAGTGIDPVVADVTQSDVTDTSPLATPPESDPTGWVDQGGGVYSKVILDPSGNPSRQVLAMPDPADPSRPKVIQTVDLAKQEKSGKGSELLQEQMKVVSNIKSAEFTLGEIENKLAQITARGPMTGRARAANPYDVEAQSLENMVNSLVPGLARGVFGEVGVLTDKDVDRYKKMIPNIKTDPGVARKIVEELRKKLDSSLKTNLDVWQASGYDVEGLRDTFKVEKSSPESASVLVSSEAEWRALAPGTRYHTPAGKEGVKK